MSVNDQQLSKSIRGLWNLHKALRPRDSTPQHRTQNLRTRAAVDAAIAELDTLRTAIDPGTPDGNGRVDLDQLLSDEDEPAPECPSRSVDAYVDLGDGQFRRVALRITGRRLRSGSKDIVVHVGDVRISLRPQRATALADSVVDLLEEL